MAITSRLTGLQMALTQAGKRTVKNQGHVKYAMPSKVHVKSTAQINKSGGPTT